MKHSKVDHIITAVGKKDDGNMGGILYRSPKNEKVILAKNLNKRNRDVQRLYNIFTPIQSGTAPKQPRREHFQDPMIFEERLESYKIKKANYERRKKYEKKVVAFNKGLSTALFGRNEYNNKVVRSGEAFLREIARVRIPGMDEVVSEEFVTLALRKGLKSAKAEMVVLLDCIKNHSAANMTKQEEAAALAVLAAVDNDFNRVMKNKKMMIRSIENQNVYFQPDSDRFSLSMPSPNGKKTSRKTEEKNGLATFLKEFAHIDEKVRQEQLRRLRRLIDTYFAAPESYDREKTYEVPEAVDCGEFNIWERHQAGKDRPGTFVPIPEILIRKSNGKRLDNIEEKNVLEALNEAIRTRNMTCYRYAVAVTQADQSGLYFEEQNVNMFWIHHIENSVERILKQRLSDGIFKLDLSYLVEKIWKDTLNFISIKYISLGKVVYNFGMSDLYKKAGSLDLTRIDSAIQTGITSFDYELIKAGETLQRELAVNVAFAANNLARATVEIEKDKDSDILLWKEEDIQAHRRWEEDEENVKAILQFFGGKSFWKDKIDLEEAYKGKGKYPASVHFLKDLVRAIYALRNESFHFTTASLDKGSWNTEFIGKMFEIEAHRTTQVLKDKFYSNNLWMFYKDGDLSKILDHLYRKIAVRASQVPSYNSVIVRKEFVNFMKDILGWKTPSFSTEDTLIWQNGCYYLMKEIYYNSFLQSDKAKSYFVKAVNRLPKDEDTKNAVEDFQKRIGEIQNRSFSEICQCIMTEYNLQNNQKRKVQGSDVSVFDEKKFQHYKLLLSQSIGLAFGQYIKDHEIFAFIADPSAPKKDANAKSLEEFLPDWTCGMYQNLIEEVKQDANLQKWYITGHFMNTRSLNLLVGSMRSFIQYVEDVTRRAKGTKNNIHIDKTDDVKMIKRVIPVLELCIQLSSRFTNEFEDYFSGENEYAEYLLNYLDFDGTRMDGLSTFASLGVFCRENEFPSGIYMDEKNPIINRNVLLSKLFGPDVILKKIYEDRRVTLDDLQTYFKMEEDIASYKIKGTCSTEQEQMAILDYQKLKNRVEFRDVVEYGELINELLGQLVNWSFLRERDLLYFQLGFHYECLHNDSCEKPAEYCRIDLGDRVIDGAILYQIIGLYVNGIGIFSTKDKKKAKEGPEVLTEESIQGSVGGKISTFARYTSYLGLDRYALYLAGLEVFENIHEHDSITELRNAIDHFKYYMTAKEESTMNYSILDLYSEIFDRFFTYDMKYQKNVVNMLSNILLSHNVVIEPWLTTGIKNMDDHTTKNRAQIGIRKISSNRFTYKLEGKKLEIDARNEDYLNMVAKILYYPGESLECSIKTQKSKVDGGQTSKGKSGKAGSDKGKSSGKGKGKGATQFSTGGSASTSLGDLLKGFNL